jgi:hypothetical protein
VNLASQEYFGAVDARALKLAAVKASTKAEKCFMGSFPERLKSKDGQIVDSPFRHGNDFLVGFICS